MEVRELKNSGAFLTLEIDGITREFFVESKTEKYSDFSSRLVNAGDCVSFSATLTEILEDEYNIYGLQIQTGYKEFEYFRGWVGLNYIIKLEEDK